MSQEFMDLTEQEHQKLNDGRMLRGESQYLLPMLAKRKEAALGLLLAHYRSGEVNMLLPVTAQLSALVDLETEIKKSNKQTEILEKKAYESYDGE